VRAAMWVELSYFPEQVRSDRSVYQELAEQFQRGMPALINCVEGNVPGSTGDDATAIGPWRFGMLDVHGWTASPYYGSPEYPPAEPVVNEGEALAATQSDMDAPSDYGPA